MLALLQGPSQPKRKKQYDPACMTAAYNAIKERGFSVYIAAREYPREYFERPRPIE
jgi:hypothetical protein